MSNSPLVNVTRLSPNCSKPRNHSIDRLTPHHTAGVLSVESALEWFSKASTQASCNYVVGNDGRIGLCVPEDKRAWTTSSRAADSVSVTIEVVNSSTGGEWPVSDAAWKSLVNLCADICKRNGIEKLNYTGDKNGNLHMHKWYANTNCPGPYLASRFPKLAAEVNAKLEKQEEEEVRYNYVSEMPKWARADIQKLVDEGYLKGRDNGKLDMTDDMIRTVIICGRMMGVLE